jgi:hypothetical protein
MARVDKILDKWLNNTPTDEPTEKVLAIIERFFSGQYSQSGGSHIVIQNDKLKGIPNYGPEGDFTVCVTGGQKVKGRYLKRLLQTIELLEELEKEEK